MIFFDNQKTRSSWPQIGVSWQTFGFPEMKTILRSYMHKIEILSNSRELGQYTEYILSPGSLQNAAF